MPDQPNDNVSRPQDGQIHQPADTASTPFRPLNNWIMAAALRDGLTCRIRSKHKAEVLKALEYHNIRAVIEHEDDTFMLVIPQS
jgi:hypothetical protein